MKGEALMFDYDVAVVGCGPAGLMAATELKKAGISVVGIDKKPDLSKNIRSASGYFITDQDERRIHHPGTPGGNHPD